jgi:hypothetical protein
MSEMLIKPEFAAIFKACSEGKQIQWISWDLDENGLIHLRGSNGEYVMMVKKVFESLAKQTL